MTIQCPHCLSVNTEQVHEKSPISVNANMLADVGEHLSRPLKVPPIVGRIVGSVMGSIVNICVDKVLEQRTAKNGNYACLECGRRF